jgi:septal ring factor EnvC (AmiA/AmiB activator)
VQKTIDMLRQELEASGEQHAALVQAQTRDSRKTTAALIETDQARAELQVRIAEIQGLETLLQERGAIIDELRGKLERDVATVRVRFNYLLFELDCRSCS